MTLTTRKKLLQQQQEEIRKAKNKKKYDNWLDKQTPAKTLAMKARKKELAKIRKDELSAEELRIRKKRKSQYDKMRRRKGEKRKNVGVIKIRSGRFSARYWHKSYRKHIQIGTYETEEEAVEARQTYIENQPIGPTPVPTKGPDSSPKAVPNKVIESYNDQYIQPASLGGFYF